MTRLLDKNPATRIGWEELPQHPFWESPLPQAAMPEQPLLEAFITENSLAPQKGDTASHEVSPVPHTVKLSHVNNALKMRCFVNANLVEGFWWCWSFEICFNCGAE